MLQAFSSGRSVLGQAKEYGGYYQHSQEILCPLPSSNELRKKRSVSDPHIGSFYKISVSNTGDQFSDEFKVTVFPRTCVSCNTTLNTYYPGKIYLLSNENYFLTIKN